MRRTQFDYALKGHARLHRVLAERALGHSIPRGAEVHHVNGDTFDTSRGNLVLCQDGAYHKLLHLRQRALDACGNANWRKCYLCKRYDDAANLGIAAQNRSGQPYHRSCARDQARRLSAKALYAEAK